MMQHETVSARGPHAAALRPRRPTALLSLFKLNVIDGNTRARLLPIRDIIPILPTYENRSFYALRFCQN